MRRLALLAAAALVAAGCSGGGSASERTGVIAVPSSPAKSATGSVPGSGSPTASVPAPTTVAGVTAGLADDDVGLAAQLISAERTIRDPAASPEAVAGAGRRQQLAYRRLGANPGWEPAVTSAVPAELRGAFDANLSATTIRRQLAEQAAAAAATAPSTVPTVPPSSEPPAPVVAPTLPAWTIRAPKPAAELLGYYREAEAATGVPWPYLAAINLIETRMGRIVGVSSAGAEGPMQFLPATWAACCKGDVWDDRDAIMGAATYLARSGAPGDMTAAVWQYNPNEAYLEMVTRYAEVMAADERAYFGYHAWEVFYGTAAGDVRLPEGYAATEPIDAASYIAAHPQDRA
jgi:hypothetical protein